MDQFLDICGTTNGAVVVYCKGTACNLNISINLKSIRSFSLKTELDGRVRLFVLFTLPPTAVVVIGLPGGGPAVGSDH